MSTLKIDIPYSATVHNWIPLGYNLTLLEHKDKHTRLTTSQTHTIKLLPLAHILTHPHSRKALELANDTQLIQ